MFRVVADQLKLRGGLVRCGSCRHVFDAIGSLSYVEDTTLAATTGHARPKSKAKAPPTLMISEDELRPIAPLAGNRTGADSAAVADVGAAASPTSNAAASGAPPSERSRTQPALRRSVDSGTGSAREFRSAPPPSASEPPTPELIDPLTEIQTPPPPARSGERQRAGTDAAIAEARTDSSARRKLTEASVRPRDKQIAAPAAAAALTSAPSIAIALPTGGAAAAAASPPLFAEEVTDAIDAPREARVGLTEFEVLEPAADSPAFLRPQQSAQKKGFSVVFGGGSAFLIVLLIAQALVLLRADLVTRWPQTRPLLVQLCKLANCTVGWSTPPTMLAVVGTELQAINGTDVLELTAVIRNRANYKVALPAIELTLTDTQNRPVARKVFAPIDYLASAGEPAGRIEEGLAGGSDYTVRIAFEARGLTAIGFVVYPFYL